MKKIIGISIILIMILTILSLNTSSPTAYNDFITVDDDGNADFTQIQDAIDYASEGDTIFVYNGTYYEMILIDKSINLMGEDKTSTIIDGQQNEFLREDVVEIKADGVNLSGFTFINSSRGSGYQAGIA